MNIYGSVIATNSDKHIDYDILGKMKVKNMYPILKPRINFSEKYVLPSVSNIIGYAMLDNTYFIDENLKNQIDHSKNDIPIKFCFFHETVTSTNDLSTMVFEYVSLINYDKFLKSEDGKTGDILYFTFYEKNKKPVGCVTDTDKIVVIGKCTEPIIGDNQTELVVDIDLFSVLKSIGMQLTAVSTEGQGIIQFMSFPKTSNSNLINKIIKEILSLLNDSEMTTEGYKLSNKNMKLITKLTKFIEMINLQIELNVNIPAQLAIVSRTME